MKYVWQQEKGSGAGLERKSASKSDAVGTEDRIQSRKQAAEGASSAARNTKLCNPTPIPCQKLAKWEFIWEGFQYVPPPSKKIKTGHVLATLKLTPTDNNLGKREL